jgi:4-amino-4-deoxy-L-arabinose transferase-like glycosyltransferase
MWRAAAWAAILFACFYGIGGYPLLDDNEGLYGSIARDMLHSGQWVIPHLNGVPYLEKPPMLYWLLAGSMRLFGVNTWAVRLVPALALFATALMTGFFLRRQRNAMAGHIAALLFATSLPLLVMGRMVLCDMVMTSFLTASLLGFYHWYDSGRRRGLMACGGFLAMAVLTKGFLTPIVGVGSIGMFMLWQRAPIARWRGLLAWQGIALFFAVAAPWHIAAMLMHPGFAWYYFVNEHLYRFLNMREPHDYYTGHIWYYVPRILAYLAPWTPFLLLLSVQSPPGAAPAPLTRFLWSWFLFCLLFFSVAGAKANYYMVAGMPALVMLLALRIEEHIRTGSRAIPLLASISFGALGAIFIAAPRFCHADKSDFYPACLSLTPPVTLIALLCILAVIAACWLLPRRWAVAMLSLPALLLLPALIVIETGTQERISKKRVADYFNASGIGEVALLGQFEEWSALAFYHDWPLVIVDSQSADLLYGQRRGTAPERFQTLAQWAAHSPRLPLVVANTMRDRLMANPALGKLCLLHQFEAVAVIGICR